MIYTEPGTYQVILDAGLAECIDVDSQWITILNTWEKPQGDSGRVEEDQPLEIKKFIMYPNPTNGQFSVEVELSKQVDINIKLVAATGNNIILSDDKLGEKSYLLNYSINNRLLSGLYFLILRTGNQSKTIRVLVN